MKKLGILLVGTLVAFVAQAQDPAPAAAPPEAAPTEAAAPAAPAADAASAPAEAAPADAATAPAEPAAAPAETASTEAAAPAEAAPAEATPSDAKPWRFYGGYDRAHINVRVSTSNPASTTPPSLQTRFGGDSFSSNFNRLRAGIRLLEFIGLEAHYGFKGDDGSDPGFVTVDKSYGFYFVPTGTFLNTVEISAVLGYNKMDLKRGNASEQFKGASYGVNAELPLKQFFASLPDFRVGFGGMVYHQKDDARIYGTHFGIRYDFKI